MAAVEVDFGGGLFERIEIAPRDDPTQVARDFCQAKGFSATIALPLAVKLEQARDKSRRLERAARQGRPVTAKPVMASTLTEEAKAALKAKEARAKAKARGALEAPRLVPGLLELHREGHGDGRREAFGLAEIASHLRGVVARRDLDALEQTAAEVHLDGSHGVPGVSGREGLAGQRARAV